MIFIIALNAACLTIFLNYIIGKPGNDFSPYEIFSNYTFWLSRRRLKKMKIYKKYQELYSQNQRSNLESSKDYWETKSKDIIMDLDYQKMIYNAAAPYFTWEKMIGMCIACSGFWISFFVGIVFYQNIVYLISIIVISHVIIRILNKFL